MSAKHMRLHRRVQHHLFRTPKRTAISFTTIFSVIGITGLLILQLATRPPLPRQTNAAGLVAPAGFTQNAAGIDLSVWNADNPSGPLTFGIARATYGIFPDARYANHVAAFRARGWAVGAYAFGIDQSGRDQAIAFLGVARGADFLALDLESNDGSTMTLDEARDFISAVHATGRKIGLYHSRSGFPNLGQDWNWVAQWSTSPPTIPWAIWQWTGAWLDRNVFNGSPAAMRAFASDQRLVPSAGLVVTSRTSVAEAQRMRTYLVALERTVTGYIVNLSAVRARTAYQDAQLATYRARRAAWADDIAFLDHFITLRRYIANLSAVARPTAKQRAELSTYTARLASWLPRTL